MTHSHYDHIGAAGELADYWDAPIYGGITSNENAENPKVNLSMFMDEPYILKNVVEKNDGDIIQLDENHALKVTETPGHTTDGVTYYDEEHKIAFVGDTIFEGSYGRTDYPGGSEEILFKSIKEKIFSLPNDTKLFSGHSNPTTVALERNRYYYK